jgi:hypothetical protein
VLDRQIGSIPRVSDVLLAPFRLGCRRLAIDGPLLGIGCSVTPGPSPLAGVAVLLRNGIGALRGWSPFGILRSATLARRARLPPRSISLLAPGRVAGAVRLAATCRRVR